MGEKIHQKYSVFKIWHSNKFLLFNRFWDFKFLWFYRRPQNKSGENTRCVFTRRFRFLSSRQKKWLRSSN